jgi:ketosteroid isomerase-like protein
MRNLFLVLAMAGLLAAACNAPKPENAVPATPAALEIGDSTKSKMLKASLMALAAGDADAFTSNLADNAVFAWNSGDTLKGKAAIAEFWKDRRTNIIDQMQVSNDIWLNLKVNRSKVAAPGDYTFAWFKVMVSYKGGKSMTQWIHNVYRFDASGKVDLVTQWVDRAPIMAAMPPAPPAKK